MSNIHILMSQQPRPRKGSGKSSGTAAGKGSGTRQPKPPDQDPEQVTVHKCSFATALPWRESTSQSSWQIRHEWDRWHYWWDQLPDKVNEDLDRAYFGGKPSYDYIWVYEDGNTRHYRVCFETMTCWNLTSFTVREVRRVQREPYIRARPRR